MRLLLITAYTPLLFEHFRATLLFVVLGGWWERVEVEVVIGSIKVWICVWL